MYRKRAVIYARQSNGKEEESESISMQIKLCREHAIKHNIEVIGEYSDANCSGRLYPSGAEQLMKMDAAFNNWYGSNSLKKKSRPGLRCVLETLQYIDYIIVYDITRLYRPVQSSYLQGYIDTLLVDNRVIVMTVREGENNPSDFSDSLVTTIKSHVNDNQIKLTSEKSKLALRKLRDSGYLVNGAGMYGIRYVGGKERRIEIIPERAKVIRYIFENILRQKPYNRILREINTLFPGRCDGKAFYMTSLRHIASQPFYCGFMYDSDGTLIPAKQMAGKAIVSLEEWRKANAIMQQGKRQAHEGNRTRLPFQVC